MFKSAQKCTEFYKNSHKFTKTFKNRVKNSYIAYRMSHIAKELREHLKKQTQFVFHRRERRDRGERSICNSDERINRHDSY